MSNQDQSTIALGVLRQVLDESLPQLFTEVVNSCAAMVEGANWGARWNMYNPVEQQLIMQIQAELGHMLRKVAKGEIKREQCVAAVRAQAEAALQPLYQHPNG